MVKNDWRLGKVDWYIPSISNETKKPSRKSLTPAQRIYIWEHPKLYGRTCNICKERITKMSDLELDHIKAFSKGGKRLALVHRLCNRMKGTKGIGVIQTKLGIKKVKPKKPTKRKKPVQRDIFGNPMKKGGIFGDLKF